MSEQRIRELREDASEPEGEEARSVERPKRWNPEASIEAAGVLRLLAVQPWLVSERDSEAISAVRRNEAAIRDALARLGWVLVVERDFVRLRKSPPVRRAWDAEGPTPQQASWFFLLVAAAESVPPRVGLAQLVTAARAAAGEAKLPVSNDMVERRAVVRALKMLDDRGVVMQMDGNVEDFVEDEEAPVLLCVHHRRLAHVIANFGAADPADDPVAWLDRVEHEPDTARRMRRRLVDDSLLHLSDLDAVEMDWVSRRLRTDDGGPLALVFGLTLERRAEGAAFVVPYGNYRYLHELGPTPFPAPGTVPHASLLLCERATLHGDGGALDGCPGAGWRGLTETHVIQHLRELAADRASGKGGWRQELAENPPLLAEEVRRLLEGVGLVRVSPDAMGPNRWWFSPATARWTLRQDPTITRVQGHPEAHASSAEISRGLP